MFKFILKLLLGLTFFIILIWHIGPKKILANLNSYELPILFLVAILTLIAFLLAASISIILGRTINHHLTWKQGLKGVLATASLAIFLPGRTGDLTLPFYWSKFLTPGECFAVIFVDKLITINWLLIYGACGALIIFDSLTGFIATLAVLLTLLVTLNCLSKAKARAFIISKIPSKIIKFLEGYVSSLQKIKKYGSQNLLFSFFITGIRIFTNGLAFWVSLYGTGAHPPFLFTILVMSFAQFSIFVPISIMGLGTVEAICIYTLSQINIDSGQVISALIVGRITTMFWLGIFFVICAAGSNFKKCD